jgi:hypothetical protein
MNNFAKALLLSLVLAAPVATTAPAIQAATVTGHHLTKASTKQMKKKRPSAAFCKAHPKAKRCLRR